MALLRFRKEVAGFLICAIRLSLMYLSRYSRVANLCNYVKLANLFKSEPYFMQSGFLSCT